MAVVILYLLAAGAGQADAAPALYLSLGSPGAEQTPYVPAATNAATGPVLNLAQQLPANATGEYFLTFVGRSPGGLDGQQIGPPYYCGNVGSPGATEPAFAGLQWHGNGTYTVESMNAYTLDGSTSNCGVQSLGTASFEWQVTATGAFVGVPLVAGAIRGHDRGFSVTTQKDMTGVESECGIDAHLNPDGSLRGAHARLEDGGPSAVYNEEYFTKPGLMTCVGRGDFADEDGAHFYTPWTAPATTFLKEAFSASYRISDATSPRYGLTFILPDAHLDRRTITLRYRREDNFRSVGRTFTQRTQVHGRRAVFALRLQRLATGRTCYSGALSSPATRWYRSGSSPFALQIDLATGRAEKLGINGC